MGYTQNYKIWHGAFLGTLIMILKKKQCEGPCEDHVLAIKGLYFGHFYERGLQDKRSNVKFDMEYPWAH